MASKSVQVSPPAAAAAGCTATCTDYYRWDDGDSGYSDYWQIVGAPAAGWRVKAIKWRQTFTSHTGGSTTYTDYTKSGPAFPASQDPTLPGASDLASGVYKYNGVIVDDWDISNIEVEFEIDPTTTCTLTYNANGGQGAPAAQTFTANVAFSLSNTTPTRQGHNFLGWAESSSAVAAQYQPGQSVTFSANKTLYAVWALQSYTVSATASPSNGGTVKVGSAAAGATSTANFTVGTECTVVATPAAGYRFVSWSDGGAQTHSFTIYAELTVSMTAYFEPIPTRTLTYNANGGQGAPAAQQFQDNIPFNLSSTKPTRAGYQFLGWGNSAVGEAVYARGQQVAFSGDKTIYAVWREWTHLPVRSKFDPSKLLRNSRGYLIRDD